MAGFGEAVDRMDDAIMSVLGDGCATYQPPDIGRPLVRGIEVMVEHTIAYAGAGGGFQGSVVGITWRKRFLAGVDKGGIWTHGQRRYIVDDTVMDDGEWLTAACLEDK